MKTEEILAERGSRYGSYSSNARVMQQLRDVLRSGDSWAAAPYEVKEALDSLCIKLGRIVNGDPTYLDNFHDAIGYLTLAVKELTAKPLPALDLKDSGPFQPHTTPTTVCITFPSPPTAFVTGMTTQVLSQNDVDPLTPGPEGTEPQDASHSAERKVPRQDGVHLTEDHVGMFFRLADGNLSPVRLDRNDGPEPERFPFKAHGKRYTEYGFVAGDDGNPLHDIVAFHPH